MATDSGKLQDKSALADKIEQEELETMKKKMVHPNYEELDRGTLDKNGTYLALFHGRDTPDE